MVVGSNDPFPIGIRNFSGVNSLLNFWAGGVELRLFPLDTMLSLMCVRGIRNSCELTSWGKLVVEIHSIYQGLTTIPTVVGLRLGIVQGLEGLPHKGINSVPPDSTIIICENRIMTQKCLEKKEESYCQLKLYIYQYSRTRRWRKFQKVKTI